MYAGGAVGGATGPGCGASGCARATVAIETSNPPMRHCEIRIFIRAPVLCVFFRVSRPAHRGQVSISIFSLLTRGADSAKPGVAEKKGIRASPSSISRLPVQYESRYRRAMAQLSRCPGRNQRAFSSRRSIWPILALGAAGVGSCVEPNQPPAAPPQITVPPVAYEPAVSKPAAVAPAATAAIPVPAATLPLFTDDLKFLQDHGPVIELEAPEHGVIALSAKYQGRVMTSAVARDAQSLGYINRQFITDGKTGTHFDNYGGEDRFWLGPEGGQFGLYFAKGKSFELANWQAPASIQEGQWAVAEKSPTSVVFTRDIKVNNYAGTQFQIAVKRTVRVLTNQEVLACLAGITTLGPVKWVGFETVDQITNQGKKPWTKNEGLLSVWVLSMYNPSSDTSVVIPFVREAQGEIVNDRYFGVVPSERLHVFADQGFLTFQCDGAYRSKIGLGPARAKRWLGSYSESATLLTLVNYDRPDAAKDYVNSMWEKQKEPYAGDVVNSYNGGPPEAGKASLGGFYELETSSPAAALAPGKSLTHVQRTLHFVGKRADLDPLAKAALGVPLDRVLEATKP